MKRLRPYFRYLLKVRGLIIAAIACGLVYGAVGGGGTAVLLAKVFKDIFDRAPGTPEYSLGKIALVAAGIPVLFGITALAGYFNSYFTQLAGLRVLEALRLDYFRKLQTLPLSFVQNRQTGDLISRGLADTAQLQFTLTQIANDGIKQPATLIGALVAVVWIAVDSNGAWMALVCLAAVPLTVFPVRYVGRKVIKRAVTLQSQLGGVTSQFAENLAAAREVRAFGLENREAQKFGEMCEQLVSAQMRIVKYAQALTPAIEVISATGIAATLLYAYHAKLSSSVFVGLLAALYKCYDPIKKLGGLNSEYKRGLASLERLEVVLNEPETITDPPLPANVTRLQGNLAFRDVTFAYRTDEPALRGVTAEIPAGTVCALVGPTGAGKSTFANLVPRFYDAGTGAVSIDGIDVRGMRIADLRRNIALVSQDPVLFRDTLLANILLGRPGATRAEAEQAARDAYAHDFIMAMPQGYDTMVNERGSSLSGGQRQRITLARAFLRNAPILILDEATSALDSDSEAAVQAALRKLVVGKTVLIIAHRFSTIRNASLILVFEGGKIVARGPHAEVYRSSPLYKSLYDGQAAGVAG